MTRVNGGIDAWAVEDGGMLTQQDGPAFETAGLLPCASCALPAVQHNPVHSLNIITLYTKFQVTISEISPFPSIFPVAP
jgi:hypothetical protein